MSKQGKREERVRKNPTNVALQDFEALINRYGYLETGAKHHKAVIGNRIMTYKRENPVKTVCVKQLLAFIDLMKKKD